MGSTSSTRARATTRTGLGTAPATSRSCARSSADVSAAPAATWTQFFGHAPKGREGVAVVAAAELLQGRGDEQRLVDRRVVDRLEIAEEPAGGDAREALRLLDRDQRR